MHSFMSPGKRIRSFRLKRGMTQRALGRAVGFPAKTADSTAAAIHIEITLTFYFKV